MEGKSRLKGGSVLLSRLAGGSGHRRSAGGGAVFVCADAGQKARAELLELAQADPLDLQEGVLRGGACSCHLTQAGVAEDEVGWDTSLCGHGPTEDTEHLEQVLIAAAAGA